MNNLQIKTNPEVNLVFERYPEAIQRQMQTLRNLIIESAKEWDAIKSLEETLKWGESSYLTKHRSTIRIDWKPKRPNQYALYFKCTSRLERLFKSYLNTYLNLKGNEQSFFKFKARFLKKN